jgi:hypothetical protein
MATSDIEGIRKEIHTLRVRVKVSGVRRTSYTRGVEHEGRSETTRAEVERSVADVVLYAAAQKLANRARAICASHGMAWEGMGHLCTAERRDAAMLAFSELQRDVDEHNARANNPHTVTVTPRSLPIGLVFGPADVADLMGSIATELREGCGYVQPDTLDLAGAQRWLATADRLGAMLPRLSADAVASAVEAIRDARSKIASRAKTLDLDLAKPEDRATACDRPSIRDVPAAVEAACGWLM